MIKACDISFGYIPQQMILENISFEIQQGSFWAILGPNGVGKTTLLQILSGLLKPIHGQVLIDQQAVSVLPRRNLARKIAVVRQQSEPIYDFSVYQTVMMGRSPYVSALGFESSKDFQAVIRALEATEITHLTDRSIHNLSGGERQRVFIARALAQETPVIMLDEPTSSLDLKHQVAILDLLKRLQIKKNLTIITIMHDLNLAIQYSNYVLVLGGKARYSIGNPSDVLNSDTINEYFDVEVLEMKSGNRFFYLPAGKMVKESSE